jgi:hypothetical protein
VYLLDTERVLALSIILEKFLYGVLGFIHRGYYTQSHFLIMLKGMLSFDKLPPEAGKAG